MIHHKMENRAIDLVKKECASKNPYEWQSPDNLVYCDLLEHLFLHILICEDPDPNRNKGECVGIGGIINFLVPELNDVYSGWQSLKTWEKNVHSLIINCKDVYFTLLKRFKTKCANYQFYKDNFYISSFNEQFGAWSREKNKKLFLEIEDFLNR